MDFLLDSLETILIHGFVFQGTTGVPGLNGPPVRFYCSYLGAGGGEGEGRFEWNIRQKVF